MKRILRPLQFAFLAMLFTGMPRAQAVTQAEINLSVNKGLAWLATQQYAGGSFHSGTSHNYYSYGTTGLAVSVFTHHAQETGQDPFDPAYMYNSQIVDALNYLFDHAVRDAGNQYVHWGTSNIYCLGPVMMALTVGGDKTRTVDRPGSAVDGMTYLEIVEEMLNYVKSIQGQAGASIGFWEYRAPTSFGDMSSTGWMALGLGYASHKFDIILDPVMMDLLKQGVEFGQYVANPGDPRYGGFGYTSRGQPAYSAWVNLYKAGHLLYIQELLGYSKSDPEVQLTLDFIQAHWDKPNSGSSGYPTMVNGEYDMGWKGGAWTPGGANPNPLPSYIASAAMMKAFLAWNITQVGTINWFDEVSERIVGLQNANGSWDQGGYPRYTDLATIWAMLTLLRAEPASGAIDNITLTSADFLPSSDLSGTGYFVVVLRGDPAPSEAEIMAGTASGGGAPVTSGSGPVTAAVESLFPLTGLSADTRYDLYFIAHDGTDPGALVRVQFATLGAGSTIDVTDLVETRNVQWVLDRNTGALKATYRIQYPLSAVGKAELHSVFWIALPDHNNWFLAQQDGEIGGKPYTDITGQVEASLQASYGRVVMRAGDSATFTVSIYSRDRSIPPIDALYAIWADPPPVFGDTDNDGKIDDQEVLTALDHWKAGGMDDFQIMGVIERWKTIGE